MAMIDVVDHADERGQPAPGKKLEKRKPSEFARLKKSAAARHRSDHMTTRVRTWHHAGLNARNSARTIQTLSKETTMPTLASMLAVRARRAAVLRLLALPAAALLPVLARAADLSSLSNGDAVGGLKDALQQGARFAISKLGATDGFFANQQVKIPLPEALQKIERGLKLIGMQRQADELVLAMNRAAEQAVPEARSLLENAVRNMSVQDARGILTGAETAATEYFRKTTSGQLTERFLPIVTRVTTKVGLAEQYNALAAKGASLGLVKDADAKIENYVTRKALDGLFTMIAEQEKAIRKDPVGAATGLARKVFGMLGK